MKVPALPHLALLSTLVVTVSLPSAAFAQQDANVERGFAPEKLYERGISGIDHINEFSGNLVVTIPIGPSFTVNGGLTYSLTLVYNAKLWNMYSAPEVKGGPPVPFAELNPYDNAGVGWRLTLGELKPSLDPSNSSGLDYVGPDGGEHSFRKENLHLGEPIAAQHDTWYTRDGSYLRLKKISGSVYEVESGDGTIHRFEASGTQPPYRLTQIRDRFGNLVTITPLVNPTRWRIKDIHRTHYVYFKTVAGRQVVDKVELAAFGSPSAKATYTFNYANTTIHEHCGDFQAQTPTQRAAALLTSVSLPADGGSYETGGVSGYHTTCSEGGVTIQDLPGALRKLKLPTGGELAWTYQNHNYPVRGIFTPGEPSLEVTQTLGVKTRRVLDASGNCVGSCTWTYAAGQTGAFPNRRRWVRVTSPAGDDTVYHFDLTTQLSTSTWTGWEYGLPFNKSTPNGSGYYLSKEIYEGPQSPANKKRSIYIDYEHDKLTLSTNIPQNWYNSNRRMVREKTVYHDDVDREATVVFSNFDGVGHFRTATLGGTFDAGNTRTATTNFNGFLGAYEVDQSTNTQTGAYSPWGHTSPWVLGTYNEKTITESGQTAKAEYCFEGSTGYLLRERMLWSGTTRQTTDLMTVYTHNASGNTIREQRYGSDLGSVGLGSVCSTSLGTELYRMDHSYEYGTLATSQLYHAGGTPLNFLSVDLTIDKNTGLPSSSRDPALVQTEYSHL